MFNQSTTKGSRMYNREKTVFSVNSLGKTGHLHSKDLNWTTFSHYTQKLKWIKKSYVRPKITKLL